jgi:hypothetical protein
VSHGSLCQPISPSTLMSELQATKGRRRILMQE